MPDADGWGCSELLGPPALGSALGGEVLGGECADARHVAWAPSTNGTGPEWVRLQFFSAAAYMVRLELWEVHAAPFVARVELEDEAGTRHLAWEGQDTTPCPGVFSLSYDSFRPPSNASASASASASHGAPFRVAAVWVHTAAAGFEEIAAARMRAAGPCVPPPPPSEPPTPPPGPPPAAPPPMAPRGFWAQLLPSAAQRRHLAIGLPTTVLGLALLWYALLAYCARDLCFLCRRAPRVKPAPPVQAEPQPAPPRPVLRTTETQTDEQVVLPALPIRASLELARKISLRTDASLAPGLLAYGGLGERVLEGHGVAAYSSSVMLP